jgi:hypothetical protein
MRAISVELAGGLPETSTARISRWALTAAEREYLAAGGDLYICLFYFGPQGPLLPILPIAADPEAYLKLFGARNSDERSSVRSSEQSSHPSGPGSTTPTTPGHVRAKGLDDHP